MVGQDWPRHTVLLRYLSVICAPCARNDIGSVVERFSDLKSVDVSNCTLSRTEPKTDCMVVNYSKSRTICAT